ncbi:MULTISPECIES: hypothetical protein [Streptomyces]|uniref:hypothetical protein n=1 Tax=Streptomyces TaxID=1883 RepID=UPI0018E01A75|nr:MULTISPECIES: hypothetical protein [Streptomyces]MCZ4096824.1 hypothetical protein [Streptomyces sp. H39-C1]
MTADRGSSGCSPTAARNWLSTARAAVLGAGGPPDQAEIAAIRARHDIQQLTPLTTTPPTR